MIFKWQDKFTENQILRGIDVMGDITEMDRTINTLSGTVNEKGEEYWVNCRRIWNTLKRIWTAAYL